MSKKLEPCPFCGGNAAAYQDNFGKVMVSCDECGAMLGVELEDGTELVNGRTATFENLGEAVAAWNRRAATEANEQLTLEELRGMDGKPVWVDDFTRPTKGFWGLVSFYRQPITCKLYVYIYDARHGARNYSSQEYGQCWLAYRRPPEGGDQPAQEE